MVDQLTLACGPLVVRGGEFAPGPNVHSNPMMVDVFPVTVAVRITSSLMTGFEFDARTVTPGGCCGRTVTEVETCSENPLVSVAFAVTVEVPESS